MVMGRKIGWALSRALLYSSGWALCIVLCLVWAVGVAYGLRLFILSTHPGWLLKLYGYGASAYVSVPNYGLIDAASVSAQQRPRHDFLSGLPLLIFFAASVVFAFAV
jgi:hypothetical protein